MALISTSNVITTKENNFNQLQQETTEKNPINNGSTRFMDMEGGANLS